MQKFREDSVRVAITGRMNGGSEVRAAMVAEVGRVLGTEVL